LEETGSGRKSDDCEILLYNHRSKTSVFAIALHSPKEEHAGEKARSTDFFEGGHRKLWAVFRGISYKSHEGRLKYHRGRKKSSLDLKRERF
jgi:hypothetical protein